jgi:hypothetical protein
MIWPRLTVDTAMQALGANIVIPHVLNGAEKGSGSPLTKEPTMVKSCNFHAEILVLEREAESESQ